MIWKKVEIQQMQDKVLSLSVENMYLFILDTVIFSLIVMATTLLMSNHQQNGRPLYMFLIPFVSQFLIKFLDTLLPTLMPEIVFCDSKQRVILEKERA